MAPTKLDELKVKANILSSFALKKVEEAYEQAGEYAGDAIKFAEDGAQAVQQKAGEVVDEVKAKVGEATGRVKAEL